MLSYQHRRHAGNHADVLKHVVLARVIEALKSKEKPFRVIDAHAGEGLYDLEGAESRRHGEHRAGVLKLLAAGEPPVAARPYLDVLHGLNPAGGMRWYPGSPAVARALLRPDDQLELLELHPAAVEALRRWRRPDRRIHVHARDSREGLPGLLPPPERRGIVLLDPAYEARAEAADTVGLLRACHGRFPSGVYLLWYPLVPDSAPARVPALVAESGIRRIHRVEMELDWPDYFGLRGSGMVTVNLPWGLEEEFAALMPWLWKTLSVAGRGGWRAERLVGE